MTFIEREVQNENMRRLRTYRGQVADYLIVARQDAALGLPVRPFPAVPRERIVEVTPEGEQIDIDGDQPICDPAFKLAEGPDGTYVITTPLKIGVPSRGSIR